MYSNLGLSFRETLPLRFFKSILVLKDVLKEGPFQREKPLKTAKELIGDDPELKVGTWVF